VATTWGRQMRNSMKLARFRSCAVVTLVRLGVWQALSLMMGSLGPNSLLAQQIVYTYDGAGNLAGVASAGATAPVIATQPQSELVESNGTGALAPVTLSVVASGVGDSYQWLSNGVAIAGATGDSLVIPSLSGTNFASYSVVIMNASGVVTSTPAALWLDSKGTGMPDWWQLEYFGNLNQQPYADYDGDGVDNLDEYLEGTNPANPNSYDPRLYIQTIRGTVAAVPAQPYYTVGQVVTLTAIPDPGEMFLGWSEGASGTKSSISLLMASNETIAASFGLPLGVALSNTNLTWTTGGTVPWFGQAEVSADGMGAAQSGLVPDGYQSTLQTVTNLSQTMYLSFWWSISAQPVNSLTFSVDGHTYASLTGGATDWQYVQTNLLSGSHTLLWTYATGYSLPTGIQTADSAWVGDVTLTPTSVTPIPPVLNIERISPNSVLLFWVAPSDGWNLEQTFNLTPANWVGVTNPVNVIDGSNEVTITPLSSNQFFRLKFP
jgi:hypothetical protein